MTDERATIPLISRKHQTSKAVACSFNILSEFPLSEYVKVGNIRDPLFLPRDRSLQSSFVCSHDISRIYGPISPLSRFFLWLFSPGFPQEALPIYIALDLAIYPLGMRGREREGASLGMHRTIMSREKLRTLRKCGRRSSGFLSPPLIFVKTDVAPVSRRGCGNF